MTWKEFKEAVDKSLAENSVDGGTLEIWYIDVTYPDTENLEICSVPDSLTIVTSY